MRIITVILFSIIVSIISTVFAQAQDWSVQFESHETLHDIEWNSDGDVLAVAGSNGIELYSDEGEFIESLHSDLGEIAQVTWRYDGTQLASIGIDSPLVEIWSIDRTANTYDLTQTLRINHEAASAIAWSPNPNQLAILGIDTPRGFNGYEGIGEIWTTVDWTLSTTFDFPIPFSASLLAWNSTGTLIAGAAYACGYENTDCPSLPSAFIVDATSGEIVQFIGVGIIGPQSLIFSSNGDLAISEDIAHVYDSDGELIYEWDVDPDYGGYAVLDWNADGTQIAGVRSRGLISIFDIASESLLITVQTLNQANTIDWNPTQNIIAVGSESGTVEIVDVDTLLQNAVSPTITP